MTGIRQNLWMLFVLATTESLSTGTFEEEFIFGKYKEIETKVLTS